MSYFALSAGVTVQLNVFTGRLPTPAVGEFKENDPSDVVVGIVAVGRGAGGCSPYLDGKEYENLSSPIMNDDDVNLPCQVAKFQLICWQNLFPIPSVLMRPISMLQKSHSGQGSLFLVDQKGPKSDGILKNYVQNHE